MEVIFGNSLGAPRRSDDEETEYDEKVRAHIADALDYEQSYLAIDRQENQAYYAGLLPAPITSGENGEAVNRSSVVSTDVRDTVLSVLPSLIRIFAGPEHVAFYEPTNEANQDLADQATDYAKHVFWHENEGFLVLHSAFKDALTVRTGIGRVFTDNDKEVTEKKFENITMEQVAMLLDEDEQAEVVDYTQAEDGMGYEEITFRYETSKPRHRVENVPPEEFRISRSAKSIHTAKLVGFERIVSVSYLVNKGLPHEEAMGHISSRPIYSDELYIRNPALVDESLIEDGILYGEYFVRIDKDGDGIEELRKICVVGTNYEILHDEIVQDHDFFLFGPDPRPHTVIGDSVADMVKDIQRIKTNMQRANLDNLAEANNPRKVINELLTNVEDALNDEVGAVIRTRGDPSTAVAYTKTPYIGADLLQNVKYMDEIRASRTGISEASKGLDPRALQSTALTGIDAIISGAQERIELIAYIFANTGYKRIFQLLLREFTDHPNYKKVVKLRGKFVEVDPSLFDVSMSVSVNPTMGKGTDTIRMQALQEVKQTQTMIIEKFGLNNPVVSIIEFRNTVIDMLALANIKNVSRYFKEVSSETLEMINSAPTEPDPATLLAQAELEKVKSSTAKAISDRDFKEKKLEVDDDFRRDKLNVDAYVDLNKTHSEERIATVEGMNSDPKDDAGS